MSQELSLEEMLAMLTQEDYDEVERFTASLIQRRIIENKKRIAAMFPERRLI